MTPFGRTGFRFLEVRQRENALTHSPNRPILQPSGCKIGYAKRKAVRPEAEPLFRYERLETELPYGHSHKHPLAPFLSDLDALEWAMERIQALRENETQLEELAAECEAVISRGHPESKSDSREAARLLLKFRAASDDEWNTFRRYTFALLTDSPSNHGPS